jgi:hypothetical protein
MVMIRLTRNHILWLVLVLVSALFMVSPAFAQDGGTNIRFEDIGQLLGPRTGTNLLFDIMLYLLFFLGMVNSLLIPDKQLFQTMLNISVVAVAVLSKLLVGGTLYDNFADGFVYTFPPCDFPVLIMNVWMFVIPLIVAGMLRSVKGKKTNAVPVSILMGLIGGAYFFLFWATKQQQCSAPPQAGDDMREQGLNSLLIAVVFTLPIIEYRARQLVRFIRNRNQD